MAVAPTGGAGPAGPGYPTPGVQGPQGPMGPGSPPAGAPLSSGYGSLPDKTGTYGLGNLTPAGAAVVGQPAGNPTPPPPAPTPEFMTPAMQQYVNQFKQSQDTQQQALNAGLVQALSGLGQRRDAAAKVAATLPHEAQRAWQGATNQAAASGRDAASAFAGPTMGGHADDHGNKVRIADARHASTVNQPLLQAGITADVSKGETTLANTHMQNEGALAQQQQGFDQAMALAKAQYDAAQSSQAAGFTHDEAMARLNSSLGQSDFKVEHPGGALTPAQQLQQQEDYYTFQRNASPATGAAGSSGFSQGDVDKLHANPDYLNLNNIVGEITSGKPGDKNYYGPAKGETIGAWLQKEYGNYNPEALRLFMAENPKLFTTAGPAG